MNFVPIDATDDSVAATVVRDIADLVDTCGCRAQVGLDFGPGLTTATIGHEPGCEWFAAASFGEGALVVLHRQAAPE